MAPRLPRGGRIKWDDNGFTFASQDKEQADKMVAAVTKAVTTDRVASRVTITIERTE